MAGQPTREEKMRDAFLVIGSQYYAHARFSSQAFYLPVSATLFHHAIEMLLKGYLSLRRSSSDLKKMGHDLADLWDLFKAETGDKALSKFDAPIRELDKVELIRYPDAIVDEGYVLHVSLGRPPTPLAFPGMEKVPNYHIEVSDMDAIAAKIYEASAVNPALNFRGAPWEFMLALPPDLRGTL